MNIGEAYLRRIVVTSFVERHTKPFVSFAMAKATLNAIAPNEQWLHTQAGSGKCQQQQVYQGRQMFRDGR